MRKMDMVKTWLKKMDKPHTVKTQYGKVQSNRKSLILRTDCNRWRRQWHPTLVLLPGKSHGRRSLVGCSPWGRYTFTFHFPALEKEMATHSSVISWRIPGRGSLVGCRLWGHTESDTTEATQQQQQQGALSQAFSSDRYCPVDKFD